MSTPVYFRKLEQSDIEKHQLFDVTEKAKIAECLDVTIDKNPFDVYIVVDFDVFESNPDTATMSVFCKSKDKKLAGDYGYVFVGNRSFKQLKELARELMNVNYLSIVTFEANHFEMFWL